MNRHLLPALAAAVIACGATSCSIFKSSTKSPTDPEAERLVEAQAPTVAPSDVPGILDSGEWTIVTAQGRNVASADEDAPLSLSFKLDATGAGTLYCYTGCNYLNGDVQFSPTTSTVEPRGSFLSTMVACDPEATATEQAIVQAVNFMRSYRLDRSDGAYFLYLYDSDGNKVLGARRWDSGMLDGAWEVTAIGTTEVPEAADVQLVLDQQLERVHGNTGCNILNGTLRQSATVPGGIEFSNLAVTRRGCPQAQAAIEQALLVALEDVAAWSAGPDGDTLVLKNAEGATLLRLRRLVLKR